jgi:hypothetical protein
MHQSVVTSHTPGEIMYARIRLVVLATLLVGAVPATAHAQAVDATRGTPVGPRIDVTATAMRNHTQQRLVDLSSMQRQSARERQSIALMIVGGAAVVLGAVIGDDVGTLFMIGGAVALLIGLYKYLQ